MRATPTKLKDGSWGIRIEGDDRPRRGDRVTVEARNGKSWSATVDEVKSSFEWEGETVHLCSTVDDREQGKGKGRSKERDRGPACRCECPSCQACVHKTPAHGSAPEHDSGDDGDDWVPGDE